MSVTGRAIPRRWFRGGSRPHPALFALLLAVALIGIFWALLVPPWQSPDEPFHFAYAQSLATRFALPGNPRRAPYSTAQSLADNAVGASRGAFYPQAVPPDWSARDEAAYLAAVRQQPDTHDGGGPNGASANPPLYYLYADLAYWTSASGPDAFDQLYAMRIWTVLLLVVTALGGWLLAGEVLGHRREAQLVCAAVCGFVPSETFISSSVNPDSMMVALWSLALWLGARVITRCGARRDSVALALVAAAAVLTKATSYALLPAVLLALVLGWLRQPERRGVLQQFSAPLAALFIPIAGWLALAAALGRTAVNTIKATAGSHPFNIRQFLSYLWQFYLPRLPFLTQFRETPGLPLYDLWIREGWGIFGWRDIAMPDFVYGILAGVSAALAVASVAILTRIRDRRRISLVAFFGLAFVALLFGLHLTDYRAIIAGQPAVIQGRYLLPVLPLFGLAVALVISRIRLGWRAPVSGGVVALLLMLQVLALGTIAGAYYT